MKEDLTKRFYVRNIKDWEKTLSTKRFSDKKLSVKFVERGIVLPTIKIDDLFKGGVCDNDFNFVAGFSRTEPTEKSRVGGGVRYS